MINLQNKMAVKVTKKVKYATALYHKINARRSLFYVESFMLFSKSAYLLDYATLLYGFINKHTRIAMKSITTLCNIYARTIAIGNTW